MVSQMVLLNKRLSLTPRGIGKATSLLLLRRPLLHKTSAVEGRFFHRPPIYVATMIRGSGTGILFCSLEDAAHDERKTRADYAIASPVGGR